MHLFASLPQWQNPGAVRFLSSRDYSFSKAWTVEFLFAGLLQKYCCSRSSKERIGRRGTASGDVWIFRHITNMGFPEWR